MQTLDDIKHTLQRHKDELKTKYKIREIGIFGSYTRQEQSDESDIDILVEFEPNAKISLLDFVRLESYLTELLGVKVDLVEKPGIKQALRKYIMNEVIYL